jgi:dTDP-4-amino-4,6-dideoxygalactose transaminase
MNIPFVDLRAQYQTISSEIQQAIGRVLSGCNFILGPEVTEFETNFGKLVNVPHAIGVSSGLDALRLGLAGLNIGQGDEVIVPANTFIATALAVSAAGARPVLVDCDEATYNIDVSQIEQAITVRTKGILPVHLTGLAADMDPILEIARRANLHVIEDAAQAHGTLYKGQACGSMGALGCFSFYPGKNLGAYGDAGMVVTKERNLADRILRLRNYGQQVKYKHVEKGFNARLDGLQASVLNVKLPYLQKWNAARARHADAYRALLRGVGDLDFQKQPPYSTHIYHLFVIETGSRDSLQKHLQAAGVQTVIHYPVPIHLQEAYADLGYKQGTFPHAEKLAARSLSLPMYAELTEEQIAYVTNRVKEFYDSHSLRRS